MGNFIPLHPKHGVNPTICQCIICGEGKNEIALLGNNYKEQAPMLMLLDIVPCDKCQEKYLLKGTLLVEAKEVYSMREKKNLPRPTGNIMVIKDEAFVRMFDVKLPPKKIAYMDLESFSGLQSMMNKAKADPNQE